MVLRSTNEQRGHIFSPVSALPCISLQSPLLVGQRGHGQLGSKYSTDCIPRMPEFPSAFQNDLRTSSSSFSNGLLPRLLTSSTTPGEQKQWMSLHETQQLETDTNKNNNNKQKRRLGLKEMHAHVITYQRWCHLIGQSGDTWPTVRCCLKSNENVKRKRRAEND